MFCSRPWMYGAAMIGPNTYSTPINPAVIHSANRIRRRPRRGGLIDSDTPPAEHSAPGSVFLAAVVISCSLNVPLSHSLRTQHSGLS